MSLHAQISPETLERLRIQQRNNTITSVIIAILVVVLVGVVMFWFLMPPSDRYTDELVAYQTSVDEDKEITKPKIQRAVENKPSTPAASSSMARVLTSNSVSEVSIPVVAAVQTAESLNFGEAMNLGDGWGDMDFGGGGMGSTSFFGNKVSGDKFLYIIDYSGSLNARGKEAIMRKELEKSVKALPTGARFQLMFFSGPVWAGGESLSERSKKGEHSNTITTIDGEELKWNRGKTDGKIRKLDWIKVDSSTINTAVKNIRETKLSYGTRWDYPFAMAFAMTPKPNAIIFMTDGLAQGSPDAVAKEYASKAKNAGIAITAIALMEPKARDAMMTLGKQTKGSFAIVGKGGRKEESEDFSKK